MAKQEAPKAPYRLLLANGEGEVLTSWEIGEIGESFTPAVNHRLDFDFYYRAKDGSEGEPFTFSRLTQIDIATAISERIKHQEAKVHET